MSLILRGGGIEKDLQLKRSEVNHLRLLLGWIRCEIGMTPDEFIEMMKRIAPAITEPISDESKQRLVAAHDRGMAVPVYVRQAIKMLSIAMIEHDKLGDVADGEVMKNRIEKK